MDSAAGMLTKVQQGLLQSIRGVGVIHIDKSAVGIGHRFQPTGNRLHHSNPLRNDCFGDSQSQPHPDG